MFSKWNSFSRVTVEGTLEAPVLEMLIDADAATNIWRGTGDDHPRPGRVGADRRRLSPPTPRRGAHHRSGGGTDVLAARAAGASRITGVESARSSCATSCSASPSRATRDPSTGGGRAASWSTRDAATCAARRSATTSSGHPRRYLGGHRGGRLRSTENYLYTVEAFQDYLGHLADDGILCLTRWYFQPPDQMLRLVTVAQAAMDEIGLAEPERR